MDGIARLFLFRYLRLPQTARGKRRAEVRKPTANAKSQQAEIERDRVERCRELCRRAKRYNPQCTDHRHAGQHKITTPSPCEEAKNPEANFCRASTNLPTTPKRVW
jgi:hypothetical protein